MGTGSGEGGMVGIVIVTHGDLGTELLRTAEEIVGRLPRVEAVSIHAAEKIERARRKIETVVQRVNDGSGVLILTDLFGGTPSNLVLSYLETGRVEVVTGVNLPMLMKLPALREEGNLRALAEKLARYGQRNILVASEFLAKHGRTATADS
jgi:PTS system mannose-specific IIA component